MSMHSCFRYHPPTQGTKAHRGQARSAPRKRARQRANAEWRKQEAARLGITEQQFTIRCFRQVAAMGVAPRVVTVGIHSYVEPERERRSAYDPWDRPMLRGSIYN